MKVSVSLAIRQSKTMLDEIRKNGFKEAMRYACHRIAEHYGDWRLGIQTGRYVRKQELGYAETGLNVEYLASSYHALGGLLTGSRSARGSLCVWTTVVEWAEW